MYELKKFGKVFTSKFVGTGPPSYKNEFNGPRSHKGWETLIYGITEIQIHAFLTSPIREGDAPAVQPLLIWRLYAPKSWTIWMLYTRGYMGARTDTTQQSGQTPDKKVQINQITVYVSGYTETDPTGMLSPDNYRLSGPTKWVCFEPTAWPDTCCSLHRIPVSFQ